MVEAKVGILPRPVTTFRAESISPRPSVASSISVIRIIPPNPEKHLPVFSVHNTKKIEIFQKSAADLVGGKTLPFATIEQLAKRTEVISMNKTVLDGQNKDSFKERIINVNEGNNKADEIVSNTVITPLNKEKVKGNSETNDSNKTETDNLTAQENNVLQSKSHTAENQNREPVELVKTEIKRFEDQLKTEERAINEDADLRQAHITLKTLEKVGIDPLKAQEMVLIGLPQEKRSLLIASLTKKPDRKNEKKDLSFESISIEKDVPVRDEEVEEKRKIVLVTAVFKTFKDDESEGAVLGSQIFDKVPVKMSRELLSPIARSRGYDGHLQNLYNFLKDITVYNVAEAKKWITEGIRKFPAVKFANRNSPEVSKWDVREVMKKVEYQAGRSSLFLTRYNPRLVDSLLENETLVIN